MTAVAAREASITTLTATLQTVVVNGKTMTLAIYRQLPLDAGYDIDGEWNGKPWGRVNYCVQRECGTRGVGGHVHLIGEVDGDLYRATHEEPQLPRAGDSVPVPAFRAEALADAVVLRAVEANRPLHGLHRDRFSWSIGVGSYTVTVSGDTAEADRRRNAARGDPAALEALRQTCRATPYEFALNLVRDEIAKYLNRRRSVTERYDACFDLPQLFLAG